MPTLRPVCLIIRASCSSADAVDERSKEQRTLGVRGLCRLRRGQLPHRRDQRRGTRAGTIGGQRTRIGEQATGTGKGALGQAQSMATGHRLSAMRTDIAAPDHSLWTLHGKKRPDATTTLDSQRDWSYLC